MHAICSINQARNRITENKFIFNIRIKYSQLHHALLSNYHIITNPVADIIYFCIDSYECRMFSVRYLTTRTLTTAVLRQSFIPPDTSPLTYRVTPCCRQIYLNQNPHALYIIRNHFRISHFTAYGYGIMTQRVSQRHAIRPVIGTRYFT